MKYLNAENKHLKRRVIEIFAVYKITNSLNGKIYVGMTKQTIEKRFIQHSTANTPLGNAMRDCGLDNFTVEVIETCPSLESAHDREKFWIKALKSKIPYGYNQSDGGEGGYPKPVKLVKKTEFYPSATMKITEALKRFRNEQGLSQKDIADTLNTTPQNVYRFEKVDSAISAEAIVKLAKKYSVSTDYILGLTTNPVRSATVDRIVEILKQEQCLKLRKSK